MSLAVNPRPASLRVRPLPVVHHRVRRPAVLLRVRPRRVHRQGLLHPHPAVHQCPVHPVRHIHLPASLRVRPAVNRVRLFLRVVRVPRLPVQAHHLLVHKGHRLHNLGHHNLPGGKQVKPLLPIQLWEPRIPHPDKAPTMVA